MHQQKLPGRKDGPVDPVGHIDIDDHHHGLLYHHQDEHVRHEGLRLEIALFAYWWQMQFRWSVVEALRYFQGKGHVLEVGIYAFVRPSQSR